jgi:RND family efflux transporter MFP subunit
MPDPSDSSVPADDALLRYRTPPRLKLIGILALVAALAVAAVGIGLRLHGAQKTEAWTDDQAMQSVAVIHIAPPKSGGALDLPGNMQAFASAPIYAQVSGYVQAWLVDIGAPVKKGQLLAQIDSRSYEAAYHSAMATLASAQSNAGRASALMKQNAIAAQANDNAQAAYLEAKAAAETARINLAYTHIVAPFDGIVTSRAVDIGQLVSAGTPSAAPLFTVADQSRLRLYVQVPQNYSAAIKPGMVAHFTVPEYPGRDFTATVAASAGAVSGTTGSVLVQLQADNAEGLLKPGGYAQVHFAMPPGINGIRLPATALIFRDNGMSVAVVDGRGKVAIKPVAIQRDMGATVDVAGALTPADRIIDNPPDTLSAGDSVRIIGH